MRLAERLKALFVAADTPESIVRLDKAADLLSDISIEKKRCYVLIGFNGESLQKAEERCETVYAKGFLPFAMLYRAANENRSHSPEWKALQRRWARYAAYRNKKGSPSCSPASLF